MMLFKLFKHKNEIPKEPIIIQNISDGYIKPQLADELLNTPRRQKLLTYIWQRTSIPRVQFNQFYLEPIQRYATLVQQFPASESHHHAYLGGMLDHGLEVVAYALKLRQSYLLPVGSTPEEQAAQEQVWSAAIAYAALLHDIGKIAVDLHVEYENGQIWSPWHGVVTMPYRFKYNEHREYRLHNASIGILYREIIDAKALDWLSQTPELWSLLLYALSGQTEHAGILGEIVKKADQASVSQELGGDPIKVMSAPKHALQRKLLDGLRYLVKNELKLNNAGASDGWLIDDGLWLVSKTVIDKLRAYLLSQGISGIPSKNTALFDVMQEHVILLSNGDKAIWNATIQSESGWSHTFTFLKIEPNLIWDSIDKPGSFNGSINVEVSKTTKTALKKQQSIQKQENIITDALADVIDLLGIDDITTEIAPNDIEPAFEVDASIMQQPSNNDSVLDTNIPLIVADKQKRTRKSRVKKQATSEIAPTLSQPKSIVFPEKVGESSAVNSSGDTNFMIWLKEMILGQKLIINEPLALVHTVNNSIYIVTPGIFMRYAEQYPELRRLAEQENLPTWRFVQKRFEKLKVHQKQLTGLNIWTCTVKGPHTTKKVHGYLLAEPENILPNILFNNPYLTICEGESNDLLS